MAIAKECANSTHKVRKGNEAGSVNTSRREDGGSRRSRRTEKPRCDLPGYREGAEGSVVSVTMSV